MPAVLIPIADALVVELNGRFRSAFTATRSYADWALPLGAPTDLRCDVVPLNSPGVELETKSSLEYQVAADIVLRKKFPAAELEDVPGVTNAKRVKIASVDGLLAIVEQVIEWLATRRLTVLEEAAWQPPQLLSAVQYSHLASNHQFTAILRQPYLISKTFTP